jgi:hypothetical protein
MKGNYKTQSEEAITNVSAALKAACSLSLIKGSATNKLPEDVNTNEIVMYAGGYGKTGWVGLCTMWKYSNNSNYAYGTIKLNTFYWGTGQSMQGKGVNGIQAVAAHELIHSIGFGHVAQTTPNLPSVIYPSVDNYLIKGVYTVDNKTKSKIKWYY